MSAGEFSSSATSYVVILDEAEPRHGSRSAMKACGIASVVTSLFILAAVSLTGIGNAVSSHVNLPSVRLSNSLKDDEKSWEILKCVPTAVPVPHVDDMTLEEKVGQMTQANIMTLLSGEDVHKYFIGSVVSGGGAFPVWGNSAPDWADMTDTYQAQAMKTRLQIPMIYGVDAVHGHNNVYGATIFPHHVGLGATRNEELVKKVAAAVSEEVASTGIRWAFSPAVSVCRDPRWGRCYESFSEDPNLVVNLTAVVSGWQDRSPDWDMPGRLQVAACAKHYMGDGGTFDGQDQGNTIVSEGELRRVHLPPFVEAIRRGVMSIMVSYSSWNGMKMTENKYLVTDVLKGELGFGGVVVSDWMAIDQLNGTYSDQVRKAINAGLDMIMVPDAYVNFTSALKEEVLAGRVPMARIDDAVTRILRMKESLGLFENGCAPRSALSRFGGTKHRAIARAAVRESLILLKNEKRDGGGSMFPLPVKAGTRILVTGNHSNNVGLQCGGWTVDWQGSTNETVTIGTTLLDGIVNKTSHLDVEVRHTVHGDAEMIAEFKPDFAVVGVGELPYSEKGGDNNTLQLNSTLIDTMRLVCSEMPCVVVLFSGRPLQVDYLLDEIDVLVAAWLPGTEGGAGLADVLFGDYNFTGILPVTWFSDTTHIPMNLDSQPYGPLMYPYGYGLNKAGEQLETPYHSSSEHTGGVAE